MAPNLDDLIHASSAVDLARAKNREEANYIAARRAAVQKSWDVWRTATGSKRGTEPTEPEPVARPVRVIPTDIYQGIRDEYLPDVARKGLARPYNNQDPLNTTWESPQALEAYLESHLSGPDGTRLTASGFDTSRGHESEWAWNHNWQTGIDKAREGWNAGAEYVHEPAIGLAASIVAGIKESGIAWGDEGGAAIDVAAALGGEPAYWLNFNRAETPSRRCTFVIDGFIPATINAETLAKRGMAILSAVLSLVELGWEIDLKLSYSGKIDDSSCGLNHRKFTHSVYLHRPGWTLNSAQLSARLSHPGWVRSVFQGASGCVSGRNNASREDYQRQTPYEVITPALGSGAWSDPANAAFDLVQSAIEWQIEAVKGGA